jgi:hypothetical protein
VREARNSLYLESIKREREREREGQGCIFLCVFVFDDEYVESTTAVIHNHQRKKNTWRLNERRLVLSQFAVHGGWRL